MMFTRCVPLVAALTITVCAEGNWPQFRGPNASGIADRAAIPDEWNVPEGQGVMWKTPVPGLGHSSPIVWNDRIFVTTAVAEGIESPLKVGLYGAGESAEDMVAHDFKVICLDTNTGKVLWEQTAHRGVPKFARHTKATHCDPTPATDGSVVVACFGAQGLYAYSLDGQKKWSKELGDLDVGPHNAPELHWGFASSPIIHDGVVYMQCDIKQGSYLAAFDAQDGRELWRTPRNDVPGWCTPTIYEPAGAGTNGGDRAVQIITNGCKHMGGYDAKSGREIWRMGNGGGIPVPAPVVVNDLVLFTSNHQPIDDRGIPQPIFAVRLAEAQGDLTFDKGKEPSAKVAWYKDKRGNYMQTPLAYQGLAFFCKDNGAAACYDLNTGAERWRERLGNGKTGFTASPVAVGGRVYWTSEEGDVFVVDAAPEFRVLARNALGETCMATPAISGGRMYFRTQKQLIAIGTP